MMGGTASLTVYMRSNVPCLPIEAIKFVYCFLLTPTILNIYFRWFSITLTLKPDSPQILVAKTTTGFVVIGTCGSFRHKDLW